MSRKTVLQHMDTKHLVVFCAKIIQNGARLADNVHLGEQKAHDEIRSNMYYTRYVTDSTN